MNNCTRAWTEPRRGRAAPAELHAQRKGLGAPQGAGLHPPKCEMRGEEPHGSAALPSLPALGWVLGTAGAGSGPQHPEFIRATPNIPGAADSTRPSLLPILSRTFGCSSGDAVLPGRGAGSPLVPTGRGCPRCAPKPGSSGPHSTKSPPCTPAAPCPSLWHTHPGEATRK